MLLTIILTKYDILKNFVTLSSTVDCLKTVDAELPGALTTGPQGLCTPSGHIQCQMLTPPFTIPGRHTIIYWVNFPSHMCTDF